MGGDPAQAGKLYLLSSGAAPPHEFAAAGRRLLLPMPVSAMGLLGWRSAHRQFDRQQRSARRPRAASTSGPPGRITPVNDINTLAIARRGWHLHRPRDRLGVQQRRAIRGCRRVWRPAITSAPGQARSPVNNYDGRSFTVSGSAGHPGRQLQIRDQQRAWDQRGGQRQLLWPDGGGNRRQLRLQGDCRSDLSDLRDLRRQALRHDTPPHRQRIAQLVEVAPLHPFVQPCLTSR